MKEFKTLPIFMAVLAGGCASGGSGVDERTSVPVYRLDEQTPCEYEAIGPVSAEATIDLRGSRDIPLTRSRVLGRAGAEVGADAVILKDSEEREPTVDTDPRSGDPVPIQIRFRFEGEAVTWIDGTCRQRA